MTELRGFQFADGDLDLLRWCYELRFATIDHFTALSKRHRPALVRRIVRLLERGYLTRFVFPGQKHIYAIGKAAIPTLVEQGIAPPEMLTARFRTGELKELFIKHAAMIADIHAALMLATANTSISLIAWKEGQELYDSVTVQEKHERRKLPVRPDAFFTLRDTDRLPEKDTLSFFLEADRSTTTHARFMEKVTAYWSYLDQGLYTKRYSRRFFRVVTVTLTEERAANLAGDARRALPPQAHRFFLFTSLKQFSLERPQAVLGDVFITPREPGGQRTRLVPPASPLDLGSDNES
jgi:hypothetical protein